MNKITDKNFVLELIGGQRIWLTEEEYKTASNAITQGSQLLKVKDGVVSINAIKYLLPAREVEKADNIKKGNWQCQYNYWHTRGQECGHHLQNR